MTASARPSVRHDSNHAHAGRGPPHAPFRTPSSAPGPAWSICSSAITTGVDAPQSPCPGAPRNIPLTPTSSRAPEVVSPAVGVRIGQHIAADLNLAAPARSHPAELAASL